VLRVQHLGPLRRLPGELDRRLDGLGARVAEEHPADAGVRPRHQLLGKQAWQQRAVHLHHVRQVKVERLVQRGLDGRMAPAERVDAEPGQEVEVTPAGVVVEVAALSPDVVAVEPESSQRPRQLMVHEPLVQSEVLSRSFRERAGHIERHATPCPV
jgi:hypothetical protein